MKKVNCSNCGALNYETIMLCFICRKATGTRIPTSTPKPGSLSSHTDRFVTRRQIVTLVLLITGGIAAYFGYQKYVEAAEMKEVSRFKFAAFRNDPKEISEAMLKLPKRFRVPPPDQAFLNAFPFRERTVRKVLPEKIGIKTVHSGAGACGLGNLVGVMGPSTYFTDGGCSPSTSENVPVFSNKSESRMLGVKRIDGYRYSKVRDSDLQVEIRAIVDTETIIDDQTPIYNACGKEYLNGEPCIVRSTMEYYARIFVERTNGNWEFTLIRLEGDTTFSDESDPSVDKPQLAAWQKDSPPPQNPDFPDMVPFKSRQYVGSKVEERDDSRFYQEFYFPATQ